MARLPCPRSRRRCTRTPSLPRSPAGVTGIVVAIIVILVIHIVIINYSWLLLAHLVTAAALLAVVIVDHVVSGGAGARLLQHPADTRHQLPVSQ